MMKLGVFAQGVQNEMPRGLGPIWSAVTHSCIVVGVAMYAPAAGFWLLTLARTGLSPRYPLSASAWC